MVAGNHDKPRTTRDGQHHPVVSLAWLHGRRHEPKRISFRDGELSILAVPALISPRPAFDPDPVGEVQHPPDSRRGRRRDQAVRPTCRARYGDLTIKELNVEQVGLRRARTLSRLPSGRAERVYSGSLEYYEHEHLGRDRRADRAAVCRERDSSSTISRQASTRFHKLSLRDASSIFQRSGRRLRQPS